MTQTKQATSTKVPQGKAAEIRNLKQSASTPTVIDLLSEDMGNRKVKAAIKGKTVLFPSFQVSKSAQQDIDHLPSNSWRIQFGSLDYLVGKIAQDYQGIPTYQQDKWKLAKQFFYASIAALGLKGEVEIKRLRLSTPNKQDPDQQACLEALKNAHRFQANGEDITAIVRDLQVLDEGVPAWLNAMNQGLWQFPDALNGVLDLGGGTAIARLISAEGNVIRASEIIFPGGTSRLADSIESSMGLVQCGPQILDAIEKGTYTLPSGLNFKPTFEHARDKWLAAIQGLMRARWAQFQGQYGQVIVVGGSAPLAKELVESNPRYIMPESDPQLFALEGMLNG